jgi:hypothetical protein
MSALEKSKVSTSMTSRRLPLNSTVLPSERLLASANSFRHGKLALLQHLDQRLAHEARRADHGDGELGSSSSLSVLTENGHAQRVITGVDERTSAFCAPVAQVVIHQHERQHRLGDRRRPGPTHGVVAARR